MDKKEIADAPATEAASARAADPARRLHLAFGQIVSVLMRTPQFGGFALRELEELVVPSLRHGSYAIAEARSERDGSIAPVAVLLWAKVSPAIDQRLISQADGGVRLLPEDYGTGEIPWLVAIAGDQRLASSLLKNVQDKTLSGSSFKTAMRGADGRVNVGVLRLGVE